MKIKIVSVSKDNQFLLKQQDVDGVSYDFIENNTKNLTVVYNSMINNMINDSDYDDNDVCVFIHSDAAINVAKLKNKLEAIMSKYDMLGLCGCEKIVYSTPRLNWFNGSNQHVFKRHGFIVHLNPGSTTEGQQISYGSDDKDGRDFPVVCIDGVCIILPKRTMKKGIRFDEQLAFDHYDTDISFEVVTRKMKLGVICDTSVCHASVGMSITQDKFLESEKIFRAKWDKRFSVKSNENNPVESTAQAIVDSGKSNPKNITVDKQQGNNPNPKKNVTKNTIPTKRQRKRKD